MVRPALLSTSVLVLSATVVFAQTPPPQAPPTPPPAAQTPPRDKPVAKTGSGVIKGRIVTADTGTPIRRAKVSLDSGNPLESRATTTDLDGRYEFTELAAGSYRVSASKGLYVPFEYGQRRAFERGKAIEVTDGQPNDKIDIALPRGGVIGGVLLDDVGDPAAGVRVTAMRQQFRDGKRGFVNIGRSVETNDIGQYRLYGLPAGTYFIGAMPSTANPLVPMLTSSTGAPTYYPGTLSEAEAQRVSVRPGQEKLLPDFTLVTSRVVKITGTASNSTGGPVQAVMLMSTAQLAAGGVPSMSTAMVKPDGTFRFNNIAPGEYALMAVSMTPSGDQEISAMPLTVSGEDISDVTLTSPKGFQASGQINFDEGTPPAGLAPAAVMLVAAPASQFTMSGAIGRAAIKEDWTFETKGIVGPRQFRFAQGLPSGWMVQSVFHRGQDITDKPLDVTEDVDGIVITLTKRPAGITGTVVDAAGKPVSDCTVVIFPEDPALGPPHSTRYLRAIKPDDTGAFKALNLPAATFHVVALEVLEPGDENDPELLEQLRSVATSTAAGWGETKNVPLKLAKFERR